MSDENVKSVVYGGVTVITILIVLAFANLYQPNAALGALTIITIFMSIVWTIVVYAISVGVIFACFLIAAALYN
jgi:hypothetical protein